jgi:hypothetical protein
MKRRGFFGFLPAVFGFSVVKAAQSDTLTRQQTGLILRQLDKPLSADELRKAAGIETRPKDNWIRVSYKTELTIDEQRRTIQTTTGTITYPENWNLTSWSGFPAVVRGFKRISIDVQDNPPGMSALFVIVDREEHPR